MLYSRLLFKMYKETPCSSTKNHCAGDGIGQRMVVSWMGFLRPFEPRWKACQRASWEHERQTFPIR